MDRITMDRTRMPAPLRFAQRTRFEADDGEDDFSLRPRLDLGEDSDIGADDNDSDHGNGTVSDDSSKKIGSENKPVPEEENQATDDVTEETAAKRIGTLAGREKGENHQDSKQDEAHDEIKGHNSDGDGSVNGNKRARRSKQEMSAGQEGMGTLSAVKKGPGRGRPSKNNVVSGRNGVAPSSTTTGSRAEKKRAVSGNGLRRSSRAAAEFATQQITEQTKRPKLAESPSATPSATGQKKGIATPGSGGGGRPRLSKRSVKTSTAKTPTKSEYEVELILDTRKKSGATEYLVKWRGYHIRESTWEPAVNLTHCAQALKEFRSGESRK